MIRSGRFSYHSYPCLTSVDIQINGFGEHGNQMLLGKVGVGWTIKVKRTAQHVHQPVISPDFNEISRFQSPDCHNLRILLFSYPIFVPSDHVV